MNPGDQTTQLAEVEYLLRKLEGAVIPEGLKEKIDLMLKRLRRMARQGQASGEYEAIAKYIDWALAVPWGRYTPDNLDLNNAKQVMDERHYGRNDVKELILEYLAILNRRAQIGQGEYESPVLAFAGVQGAGKTTMAKAIAEALGRPFFRISLGAIGSASELRGVPYEDTGGEPGQVIRALVRAKCMNPVILLDEFDKVSGSEALRTDFMAIMLEILDPQQNTSFKDSYIDYPVDLSKVLFILTANRLKTVTRELLDRLEIVEYHDYTPEEKLVIAKNYLWPKILSYAGLQPQELQISDDAWPAIVQAFGKDQGVRRLERNLQKMARKVLKQIVLGQAKSITINGQSVAQFVQDVLPSIKDIRNIDYTEEG